MFGQTYYHKTLRKYVSLFGTLFNDIYINRTDLENNDIQTLKVPITYGPKNKGLARLTSDPKLNRPFEVQSPVISFEMTGMTYASDRKLNTVRKHSIKVDTGNSEKVQYAYNPVPYDINFSLYVYTKYAEDGTRVLEQILPYFTPDWTATINLIPELDIKMDIPVIIQSVNSEDSYEGAVDERRIIVWTLNFVMKGYMFGRVRTSEIIKLANTNFYSELTATPTYDNITIMPGLQANGSPTTNSSLSIDRKQIVETDDWAYIITKDTIEKNG